MGEREEVEALAVELFAGWSGAGWHAAADYWRDDFRERAAIVLASDWLRAHDERVRADERERLAGEVEAG